MSKNNQKLKTQHDCNVRIHVYNMSKFV